jgi:hypothetical protein
VRNVLLPLFPNQRAREPEPTPICWLEAFSKPTNKRKKQKKTRAAAERSEMNGKKQETDANKDSRMLKL